MSTSYRNLHDEDLVHRISTKRDAEAFSALFLRYKHLALGVCLKYLSDELAASEAVQQIFMKLWNEADLHRIPQFKPWFYKVIRNHCLMELRKQDADSRLDPAWTVDSLEWEDNLYHKVNEEQALVFLNLCLQALKPDERICIRHFYIQGRTYQETALETGMTYKEVKSHIQSGRRNLQNCLLEKLKASDHD